MASFRRFLAARGLPAPGPAGVWLRRRVATLVHLVEANVLRSSGAALRQRRKKNTMAIGNLLFQWANAELCMTYRRSLPAIEQASPDVKAAAQRGSELDAPVRRRESQADGEPRQDLQRGGVSS